MARKEKQGQNLLKTSSKKEKQIPLELRKTNAQLNSLEAAQRLNDVMGMILDGRPREEVEKLLVEKYEVGRASVAKIISEAYREIYKQEEIQLDDIITSHVERYEDIYSKLIEIKADKLAMDALKAKEKIIQLHKNGTHMKVVGGNALTVMPVGSRTYYDPNRLSKEQGSRLDELLIKIDSKKEKE